MLQFNIKYKYYRMLYSSARIFSQLQWKGYYISQITRSISIALQYPKTLIGPDTLKCIVRNHNVMIWRSCSDFVNSIQNCFIISRCVCQRCKSVYMIYRKLRHTEIEYVTFCVYEHIQPPSVHSTVHTQNISISSSWMWVIKCIYAIWLLTMNLSIVYTLVKYMHFEEILEVSVHSLLQAQTL